MTVREWLRRWSTTSSEPVGYAIAIDDGPWQDVPMEGYIAAEREAGFGGPDTDTPATLAFVGRLTHGIGHAARSIRIEGKVVLR